MLNTQPSMYQQYHQYKYKVDDSIPFSEQKKQATAVVRNIAQTIFERFGCGSIFNDDCIQNFGEMYNPANFRITLLNFQPTKSIFAFLLSVPLGHFLSVRQECTFSTDESGLLYNVKVSYIFVESRNSQFIASKVSVVYNGNFELAKVHYERKNQQKDLLVSVDKTKDMLCSVENETLFLELFMNDNNHDLRELFPAFFQDGVHVFGKNEIEINSSLARMLLI